jgi:hypothetical protein
MSGIHCPTRRRRPLFRFWGAGQHSAASLPGGSRSTERLSCEFGSATLRLTDPSRVGTETLERFALALGRLCEILSQLLWKPPALAPLENQGKSGDDVSENGALIRPLPLASPGQERGGNANTGPPLAVTPSAESARDARRKGAGSRLQSFLSDEIRIVSRCRRSDPTKPIGAGREQH